VFRSHVAGNAEKFGNCSTPPSPAGPVGQVGPVAPVAHITPAGPVGPVAHIIFQVSVHPASVISYTSPESTSKYLSSTLASVDVGAQCHVVRIDHLTQSAPVGHVDHVGHVAPVAQSAPVGHVGHVGPVSHVGHVAPVAPVGPVDPVAHVSPVGHAGHQLPKKEYENSHTCFVFVSNIDSNLNCHNNGSFVQ